MKMLDQLEGNIDTVVGLFKRYNVEVPSEIVSALKGLDFGFNLDGFPKKSKSVCLSDGINRSHTLVCNERNDKTGEPSYINEVTMLQSGVMYSGDVSSYRYDSDEKKISALIKWGIDGKSYDIVPRGKAVCMFYNNGVLKIVCYDMTDSAKSSADGKIQSSIDLKSEMMPVVDGAVVKQMQALVNPETALRIVSRYCLDPIDATNVLFNEKGNELDKKSSSTQSR